MTNAFISNRLRDGGEVSRTLLPPATDLDAMYPKREQIARTATGTAWGATGEKVLLILDERAHPEAAKKHLVVLAFGMDSASIRVYTKVVNALLRESNTRKEGDNGSDSGGGMPLLA